MKSGIDLFSILSNLLFLVPNRPMHDVSRGKTRAGVMTMRLQKARSLRRSFPANLVCYCLSVTVLLVILQVLLTSDLLRRKRRANLAFFVQVSDASISHVPRLLRAIWHQRNVYVLHFDARINHNRRIRMIRFLREEKIARHSNVLIMDSEPVSYAGVSMLVNTINAISMLLRASESWDYFINLSGHDYPLVSAENMRELLGMPLLMERKLNLLQSQEADKNLGWFFIRRIRRLHVDTALWGTTGENVTTKGELIELNATHPVKNGRIVKTEGWVILHRKFCKFAVESAASRRLLLSFATARAADELFFGTLLTGSEEFRDKVVWDRLRFVLWGMNGDKWPRPAFLDEVDGEEVRSKIVRSGALFARKFRETEGELMRFVDTKISGIAERGWDVDENSVKSYVSRVKSRLLCIAARVDGGRLREGDAILTEIRG